MAKPDMRKPLRERATCAACDFSAPYEDNDKLLRCKRRAPSLMGGNQHAIFPIVSPDNWCGDFREELNG
jgi:hypothetical protein